MQNKLLLIISFSILMTLTVVSAHTGEDDYAHHGMMGSFGGMMSGSYGYNEMFFGWIFGILVLFALVLLIVWLIKQIQKKK